MPFGTTHGRLVLHFEVPGENRCLVSLPVASTTAPGASIDEMAHDLADGANAAFAAIVPDVFSVECRFIGCDVQLYHGADDYGSATVSADALGDQGGDSLPSFCAVLIRRKSGYPQRARAGRNYWPGVAKMHTNDYKLNDDGLTAWSSLCDMLDNGINAGAAVFNIVNRDQTGGNDYNVTSFDLDSVIRTMRSRRVKGLLP